MRKYILIARSNIRKAKGQNASIIILILSAALMFNLWLMLSMDYKANFDRYHDLLNAGHVTLSVDGTGGGLQNFLSRTLETDSHISEFCFSPCMHMAGSFSYNGGDMSSWFVFMEKQAALTRSIGRIEIVEEGIPASGVYLPIIYKTGDIAVGKPVEISIGSHKMTYTVCGFFNSIMMGSHNCVMTQIILTKDKYAELEKSGYVPQATLCSVRLYDASESLNFEASLKSTVAKQYPDITMTSNCYHTVSQSRYISQMICSGIMAAMAFFVLLITLVVIVSNIVNYIQVNMKNLGALKAVGYTSKQLIFSLLLQFLSLTFLAALMGAGLSYCLFPSVNAMMTAQTGIPYKIHFLPLPLAVSLSVLCGAVALAVWLASRRIQKTAPITALRFGIQTHNFKRNHVPLQKTGLPLPFALALKTTFSGMKNNISVCVTMMVLSLVVVFSGLMAENVIRDMTPFINLIVGETADSCINVQAEKEAEFLRKADADIRTEKVYLFHSLNVSHVGGAELMATLCDDFSKISNQDIVFSGRFPKYDNEIAIAAKYAKENGLNLGDEIDIDANGRQEKYLICGFTQLSNNLGRDCLFTQSGYERLGTLTDKSYYIDLSDDADIDAFNLEMEEICKGSINSVLNVSTMVESMAGVYVSLMTIIVIAIFVLSVIIIIFVLYLLVRTMLNNKIRDYGIMKALGFTTGQLILQTALSFMPAVIVSSAASLILSSLVINPLTALFLSGIGIVKCTFTIPAGFIMAAGTGLIGSSFAIACLLSLKIRKITPKALLSGE